MDRFLILDDEIARGEQLVAVGQQCAAKLLGISPPRTSNSEKRVRNQRALQREIDEIEGTTTDIMGLSRWRARATPKGPVHVLGAGKRSAAKQSPALNSPTTRSWQPTSRDGRQTFHFDHSTMSKVDRRTAATAVKVGSTGRASNHSRYVERDDAVARIPIGASLDATSPLSAADHSRYIERSDAVASAHDRPMTYHNIDDDPAERLRYWDLVEELERAPGSDRLTVRYRDHPEYWDRVASIQPCFDPGIERDGCPDDVRDLIATARVAGEATGAISSSQEVRRWLYQQTNTWRPEFDAKTGKKVDKSGNPGQWHDARSGRVQQRVNGSLPACLSLKGIDRAARAIADEMEKLNVTYELNVHAPGYDNDDKNWHFHLDYNDRPSARLSNGEWDFAQATIDKSILEQPQAYGKQGRCRQKFPYRQNKTRANVADRKWVEKFRHRVAELINIELEREGHAIRYYGGSAKDLDLPKGHLRHLGSEQRSAQLLGVSTLADAENEASQYVAKRQWFASVRDEKKAEAEAIYQKQTFKSGALEPDAFEAIYDGRSARTAAADLDYLASCARDDCERVTSRPDLLCERLPRYLNAIEKGVAKPHDRKREELYRKRLNEAREARADLKPFVVLQMRTVSELEGRADALRILAQELDRRALELSIAYRPAVAVGPNVGAAASTPVAKGIVNDAALPIVHTEHAALAVPAYESTPPAPVASEDTKASPAPTPHLVYSLGALNAAILDRVRVHHVFLDGERGWQIEARDPELRKAIWESVEHPETVAALHKRQGMEMERLGIRPKPAPPPEAEAAGELGRQNTEPSVAPIALPIVKPLVDRAAPNFTVPPANVDGIVKAPAAPPASRTFEPSKGGAVAAKQQLPEGSKIKQGIVEDLLFNAAMERIVREGDRIQTISGRLTLNDDAMRELELTQAVLDHPDRQARLLRRQIVQQRDETRLLAFAQACPGKVILSHKRISLAHDAPAELIRILERSGRNWDLNDALRAVVEPPAVVIPSMSDRAAGIPELQPSKQMRPASATPRPSEPSDVQGSLSKAESDRKRQQRQIAAAKAMLGRSL